MRIRIATFALCLLGTILASCGTPGVPLPPSLELARPVTDLRATRKGDKVFLTWSPSSQTIDRRNLRHSGPTQICRNIGSSMPDCGNVVFQVEFSKTPAAKNAKASYTDTLPPKLESEHATSNLFYAVNVQNSFGRSAGLSNQVSVPAAPILPPPADFKAELTSDAVRLSWNPVAPALDVAGLRYSYRVFRRDNATSTETVAGELPLDSKSSPGLLDRAFEWEKTYSYRATVVTLIAQPGRGEQQVEGEDTPPVTVAAHDVFPPATPAGLQAVFSGPGQKPFIDLLWTPNSEADLAGYNVYRRDKDAQAAKATRINSQLVLSPLFRDFQIPPGREYFYSVSAVDARGNESLRSDQSSEAVPAP